MDPAEGAHRGEPADTLASPGVNPTHRAVQYEDLQMPGGATDPLWYLAARHLCPTNMSHTHRLRWIEGFVAGMELLRGVNVPLPGVTEVLRGSIRLEAYEEGELD